MIGVAATARMTAAARARESTRSDALFVDPLAAGLAGDEGFDLLRRQEESLPGRGPAPTYAIRHRFLDDFVREGVARGISQVVLLGAGLDTRAFRLDCLAGTTVFEVDQLEVLQYKEARLTKLKAPPAICDRRVVVADLGADWKDPLREGGFISTHRTVWVAEGLLFYLSENGAARLLETAAELSAGGSRLGADTLASNMLSSPWLAGLARFQAEIGAPFTFTTDDPAGLLLGSGWDPTVRTYPSMGDIVGRAWPYPPSPGAQSAVVTANRVQAESRDRSHSSSSGG